MRQEIEPLRALIRSRREEMKLSREDVADLASIACKHELCITSSTVAALEISYQRMPPAALLRPVADVLELDWEDVLRAAGY